jgi:hypothetical protein
MIRFQRRTCDWEVLWRGACGLRALAQFTGFFQTDDGSLLTILQPKAYHVPEVNQRLLSPQSLFKERIGITGWYRVGEFESRLAFDGLLSQTVRYQAGTGLPTAYEYHATEVPGKKDLCAELNMCVTCEDHQNLTPAAKLLLQWH